MLPNLRNWLQLLAVDPNTQAFTLRTLKRLIASKEGMDDDEIELIFPRTPDELEAMGERDLLSRNVNVEFTDMNQDWFMKMTIYQPAVDTEAKTKALMACRMAYQMTGQNAQQNTNQIDDASALTGVGRQAVENSAPMAQFYPQM